MKKHVFYWLAMVIVLVFGCKKEESFELGNTPSEGSLQSDVTGDCLPKTVNGVYVATTPLVPATNTITISVNVTRTGTYLITTDTVNGYFFRGTGTFTTLGNNNVTLRSNGTPFIDGTDNFVVSYNGTVCDISIDVLPAGTGAATFALVSGGTPVNCASAVVTGTYVTNGVLNPLNHYVDIQVNVTQVGTYTITATGGGMTFTKTGVFAATGNTPVRLDGNGTAPAAAGPVTVTFAAPFASCSFTVPVTASAVFSINCGGAIVAGTYTAGTALTASHTITIPVTVTTPGSWSISTAIVNGMVFSGSGSLTASSTSIVLSGTGSTPTAAASPSNIVLPAPFASCTVPVTVGPATGGAAVFTINCGGAIVAGTYTAGTALTASHTITIPVTVTTPGTWTITTAIVNGMIFSGSGSLTASSTSIVLSGNGSTPTAAASPSNIVLPPPFASCTVPVTVGPATGGAAVFTINCAGATVQGVYQAGMALAAANTITIPVTVTTAGTWSITTNPAVNGMTFTGSGNLTLASTNIVLTGSGTPATASATPTSIALPAPFASCTVPVPVVDWSFKIGSTTYSGIQSGSAVGTQAPYSLIDFDGSYNGIDDLFYILLGDPVAPTMSAGETYRTDVAAPGPNAAYFYFDNIPALELEASDPTTTPGVNITFTITSHNTTTKTIIGTFTGTAFDYVSSTNKTITNGTFKIVYP